jgi:hypothetical protein
MRKLIDGFNDAMDAVYRRPFWLGVYFAVIFALPLLVFGLASKAFGQDAGLSPPIPPVPPSPADGNAYAQLVLQALDSKNYHLLAALAVIGLTWAAKKYGTSIPAPVGPFLKTDRGGAILVLLMGVGAAIGNGLYAGAPFSLNFLVHGLVLGVTAAGGFNLATKIFGVQAPLNPAPVVKAMVALALVGSLFYARPARAETQVGPFTMSVGPTIPFLQYEWKNPHPASVGAGAGMMASFSLPQLQMTLLGKSYDMLAVSGMAFGQLVSGPSGAEFGQLSAAVALTTLNSLLGVGYGHALLDASGAFPGGPGFLLLVFSIQFALGPYSPPVGIAKGPSGVIRGNTLYLGW